MQNNHMDMSQSIGTFTDEICEKGSVEQAFGNGRWTNEEHDLFIEALLKYGSKWDSIQAHVRTRDKPNIRSHA